MHACTIVTRSYLPFARVLTASFLEHHPSGEMTALVVDGERGEFDAEPFDVWTPDDLRIPQPEFRRMATIYDALELSTALKPFLLESLLSDSDEPVTYFDADIQIFAPLDDIDDRAREAGIVLTPHLLSPMRRDNLLPNEASILSAGVFNLGFIALGSNHPMLPWWQERLRRHCLSDPADGAFVDQRWIDFVPGLWEHAILRDVGCNVAYWNVDQRAVTVEGVSYFVNDRPLRFFHFSGYSPEQRSQLSGYQTRIRLDDHPALARLCDDYGTRLMDAGYLEGRAVPYRYNTTASGTTLDTSARRAARTSLMADEAQGIVRSLPDPFDPDGGTAFIDYLRSPTPSGAISRYLEAVWKSRPDLQYAFPDPSGGDPDGFRAWVDVEGRHQDGVSSEFL